MPAVLKINRQINQPNCLLLPDFQSAIAFRTASRIPIRIKSMISPPQTSPSIPWKALPNCAIASGLMFPVATAHDISRVKFIIMQ